MKPDDVTQQFLSEHQEFTWFCVSNWSLCCVFLRAVYGSSLDFDFEGKKKSRFNVLGPLT